MRKAVSSWKTSLFHRLPLPHTGTGKPGTAVHNLYLSLQRINEQETSLGAERMWQRLSRPEFTISQGSRQLSGGSVDIKFAAAPMKNLWTKEAGELQGTDRTGMHAPQAVRNTLQGVVSSHRRPGADFLLLSFSVPVSVYL